MRRFFDWLTGRDQPRDHDRAFDAALRRRGRQLDAADEVVAQTRQARSRLELDIFERRAEIARHHDRARRAARAGDDDAALRILERKQTLHENLSLAERELEALVSDLTTAEGELDRLHAETRELQRQKRQLDARLSAARARDDLLGLQDAAARSAADRALDAARGRVEALSARRELEAELSHDELEELVTTPAREHARLELSRLKAKRRRLTAV